MLKILTTTNMKWTLEIFVFHRRKALKGISVSSNKNAIVQWLSNLALLTASCLRASIVTRVAQKCWLVMIVFHFLYKPG